MRAFSLRFPPVLGSLYGAQVKNQSTAKAKQIIAACDALGRAMLWMFALAP